MKKQTMKWCESVPKEKLNIKNMFMVISSDGKVSFYPRHLRGL